MRKGGGKNKGSAFEREICKELSLWVSKGKQKDIFWRSAMSGGRSTVAMKGGDKLGAQAGDISSIHKRGHDFIDQFTIECKFYRSLNYESFIKGKGKLLDFWSHARKDAKQYGKKPLLIAKQNHYPVIVCLDRSGMRALRVTTAKIKVMDYNLYLMLFDDFLEINPKILRKSK